jgi:hypothetical protein
MTNSTTRKFFPPTSLLKQSFRRSTRRRLDPRNPEASTPGRAPKMPQRTNPRAAPRLRMRMMKRMMMMSHLRLKAKKRANRRLMTRVNLLRLRRSRKLIS